MPDSTPLNVSSSGRYSNSSSIYSSNLSSACDSNGTYMHTHVHHTCSATAEADRDSEQRATTRSPCSRIYTVRVNAPFRCAQRPASACTRPASGEGPGHGRQPSCRCTCTAAPQRCQAPRPNQPKASRRGLRSATRTRQGTPRLSPCIGTHQIMANMYVRA
jgi:hypothetical protein